MSSRRCPLRYQFGIAGSPIGVDHKPRRVWTRREKNEDVEQRHPTLPRGGLNSELVTTWMQEMRCSKRGFRLPMLLGDNQGRHKPCPAAVRLSNCTRQGLPCRPHFLSTVQRLRVPNRAIVSDPSRGDAWVVCDTPRPGEAPRVSVRQGLS